MYETTYVVVFSVIFPFGHHCSRGVFPHQVLVSLGFWTFFQVLLEVVPWAMSENVAQQSCF